MKSLFILIIVVFLFSCNNVKVKNKISGLKPEYTMNFKPSDKKLCFKINNHIINQSVCLYSYTSKDSIPYLFYLSEYTNKLCIFNIDSQKLENIIEFERQGPNGVGSVHGFEILSFDSILVISNHQKKFYVVNQKGTIVSSIDYTNFKQYDGTVNTITTRSYENMRLGFKNSKIYAPFYPTDNRNNYKTIDPEKLQFIAEFDTAAHITRMINSGFPKNYWENKYKPAFFGFFISKGKFYINYMFDDNIIVSNNAENWQNYNIKSKYIDIDKDFSKVSMSSCYDRLVENPFRNEFYRFVTHKQKTQEDRTESDMIKYPSNFSIIILDKDLNIIGETVFPSDTYDNNGYFITKDGLYLSLSNPFNPNYNVDLLEFQLFKIVKDDR